MKSKEEKHSEITSENYILLQGAYEILQKENTQQQEEIARQHTIIAEQQIRIEYLEHEFKQLQRMIFGSKSERFVPTDDGQLSLGLDVEAEEKAAPETETFTVTRRKKEKEQKPGHSRLPIPAHIPRVEHYIEPEGDITGGKKIGEEITEVLEYKQGSFFVNKYIRPKYALPEEKGIVIGILPSLPIPKGNAGVSLLTQILVSKYVDHLPFHRQIEIYKRDGVVIPESTMNDWFRKSCDLLTPLYNRIREKVQCSSYIQADESPMPVQTKEKKNATHKGYEWVYHAVTEKLVCFDYRKDRSREGPKDFLKDFSGTVQPDGYSAYYFLEAKKDVKLNACMAHARRKFFEAKENDQSRATWMADKMRELYEIEEKAREKEMTPEQRKELRLVEATPVLDEMETWLNTNITQVLPKSAIGEATAYTFNLWLRLKRYLDDGRYEIDNNLIENTIRPLALGRKNYMFAGSHEGAQRAAVMYSLFGSCKLNNIEPYSWLKDVLERLPDTKMSELDALLPNAKK
ncbi:MAG: IS66 family transposase [Bacteroidota bacterium]